MKKIILKLMQLRSKERKKCVKKKFCSIFSHVRKTGRNIYWSKDTLKMKVDYKLISPKPEFGKPSPKAYGCAICCVKVELYLTVEQVK